jgi:alkylhydroperoxidase family enzyme
VSRTNVLDREVGQAMSALGAAAKTGLGDPALAAWEEAEGVYDERERAALALTEAVTVLTAGFVPDEVYERAAAHFDEERLAPLVGLVAAINNWNRVMVGRRIPPGGHQP